MIDLLASITPETYRAYFVNEVVFWMGAALIGMQIYRILQSRRDSGKLDEIIKRSTEHNEQIRKILERLAEHQTQINFSSEFLRDLVGRHERLVAQVDLINEKINGCCGKTNTTQTTKEDL